MSSGDQISTLSAFWVSYTRTISWRPSWSTSTMLGVDRTSRVSPMLTCHAIFASSPATRLRYVSVVSLWTSTANKSSSAHRSSAAGGAVMLFEKSAMIEPYASAPSMSSNAAQFTPGLSMVPSMAPSITSPSPGPPSGPWSGMVALWVGVRPN